MFGFFRPSCRISGWLQSYARICQTQRRMFGLKTLQFLSYEATFLYQLAIDTALIPQLPAEAPECCRLRKLRNADQQPDIRAAEFAAAFGMLLAGVKLQDDVADHGRWQNHVMWFAYRRAVQRAEDWFENVVPGLRQQITEVLDWHRTMESSNTIPCLTDYVKPTGTGFGLLFGGLARLLGEREADFQRVGTHVGQAIIAWDCAADFNRDRIYGEFNPLRSQSDVSDSLQLCLLELARLGWALPEQNSVCRQVAESVAARVYRRLHQAEHVCRTTRLERWGLIRARGYQYARCDGCEGLCAVAECGECACAGLQGASDGAACCAGGLCESAICCDPCCAMGSESGPVKQAERDAKATEPSKPSLYEQYHGREGTAYGDLNPEGLVMIDSNRLPARSDGGQYIVGGTTVRVIRTDPLGITVRIVEA